MKPIKALRGNIEGLPHLDLHILLTSEDGVIVARCLDFSVSSHGENIDNALASLSDSIGDYLNYAFKKEAFDEIIDPEENMYWEIFKKLELQKELITIKNSADILKEGKIEEVIYA